MATERMTASFSEVVGVVLGGGRGTRLYSLTAETSKHLLPVGDKPMVVRVIDQLLEVDIKDILLLIDERYASQFMQVLKDGSHLGVRSLAYIWQSAEGGGLPSAMAQVEHFIRGGRMVVVCGDVLIEEGIVGPVRDFVGQERGARMAAVFAGDTAGYSLLRTSGGNVVEIKSKDKTKHGPGLIDLGIYMYDGGVFEKIRELVPSTRGETEIWDLNMKYVAERDLKYTVVNGWWSDVGGSLEAYLAAGQRYAMR